MDTLPGIGPRVHGPGTCQNPNGDVKMENNKYTVTVLAVVSVEYEVSAETVEKALKIAEDSVAEDLGPVLVLLEEPASFTGECVGFIVGDGDGIFYNHEYKIEPE